MNRVENLESLQAVKITDVLRELKKNEIHQNSLMQSHHRQYVEVNDWNRKTDWKWNKYKGHIVGGT